VSFVIFGAKPSSEGIVDVVDIPFRTTHSSDVRRPSSEGIVPVMFYAKSKI